MQGRRDSIANALELRLSCTNLSIYGFVAGDDMAPKRPFIVRDFIELAMELLQSCSKPSL